MRALSFSRSLADRPIPGPALRRVNRDRRVRWIPRRVPDGEEAAAVWCAVYRCGLSTYGEVAGHVAEHLFRPLDGTLVQIDSV